MDRGYQSHHDFDLLQERGKHFVCRIKAKTTRTVIEKHEIKTRRRIPFGLLAIKLPELNILWQLTGMI